MKRNLIFPVRYACLCGLFLLPCCGALITYTDRPAFTGAAPNLPVETFAAGLVSPARVITCSGPLSSAIGSACFPAGVLLPGVVYSSTSGLMALIGARYPGLGNTSQVLGPNAFNDTFNLTFTRASVAGFDVFAGPTPGNVLISVYNPANALLGTFTVAAPLGGGFFGVTSDTDLIGRINISSQAVPAAELIGNLSFGVPEPCSLLLSGVGLIGIVLWRRQKQSLRS